MEARPKSGQHSIAYSKQQGEFRKETTRVWSGGLWVFQSARQEIEKSTDSGAKQYITNPVVVRLSTAESEMSSPSDSSTEKSENIFPDHIRRHKPLLQNHLIHSHRERRKMNQAEETGCHVFVCHFCPLKRSVYGLLKIC